MKKRVQSLLFIFFILLATITAHAAAPVWKIVPAKSRLTFTATQNDAPVSGRFQKFTGDIVFDPDDMKDNHVTIVVDTSSVYAAYTDLVEILKTADWLDIKAFPQATFKADHFIKKDDKNYQANGILTIRKQTIPITIDFHLEEMSNTQAHVKGTMILKRNQFGVGQGEWASTKEVKDEVKVEFILSVVKKV
jgi:polyisoprenoid-binding protein YceI